MRIQQIVCPISTEKVDSNVSRLTVFFNVISMALFISTLNPLFIILVSADYFIRAFLNIKFSPVRLLAMGISATLRLKKKSINLAQKVFASRLGFLCAFVATILYFAGFFNAAIVVTVVLGILSTLDSVFNICLGCIIYNYVVYPFYKKSNI